MRKPTHSAPRGQETPLEGFDVQSSASQDNTPRIAPQTPRLSIVYGTCCRCHDQPATLKSPSGNPESIYCEKCGISRCKMHTIADFVLEESSGLWLDPCAVKSDLQQESLIEAE